LELVSVENKTVSTIASNEIEGGSTDNLDVGFISRDVRGILEELFYVDH